MKQLKEIHAHTLRNGIDHTKYLIVKLLSLSNISYARSLFDHQLIFPTTFLYNKLLQAYASHALPYQCLSLFSQMLSHSSTPPNTYSFTFVFTACATLPSSPKHGRAIHALFLKMGFRFDAFVFTSLVDMYAKSGVLEYARRVFDEMPERDLPSWNSIVAGYAKWGALAEANELFERMPGRNVVSWTAMVSGYCQNGRFEEAMEVFLMMEREAGVRPNEVTLASVLPACAKLGALELGERIDRYARENGFLRNVFVANALVEMYAKCGRIDKAQRMFEEMGRGRNLCSWNSMIMGLAVHGRWKEGLELFHEMLASGITPDDITFVAVLLACTHGGLVDHGWRFFESMEKEFSLSPKLEHYGCMVDLLGRSGQLDEAYALITSMPMSPDSVVWGALLGACSFYGHVEMAERVAEFLFELEPWNPGNYVILSNVYAASDRWDGVAKVRIQMKGNQMKKAAGYSFIESGGIVHKFIVEDRSHQRSDEIYALLDEVMANMKLLRYFPNLDSELENYE
ncbi:pentatricopeptide repeat-containing protein At5g08510 [Magnolia sinica]|uniref:pentatricopeptide repeat-containing protein At5g08510 n=1 Tax=Magnolia sinica TaxID=86752 RepID=UPI002657B028|nr:pentatricopeptide repeat-containing protein At5g08510 [Magnolia sinica]